MHACVGAQSLYIKNYAAFRPPLCQSSHCSHTFHLPSDTTHGYPDMSHSQWLNSVNPERPSLSSGNPLWRGIAPNYMELYMGKILYQHAAFLNGQLWLLDGTPFCHLFGGVYTKLVYHPFRCRSPGMGSTWMAPYFSWICLRPPKYSTNPWILNVPLWRHMVPKPEQIQNCYIMLLDQGSW